jgi:hypothetical protein
VTILTRLRSDIEVDRTEGARCSDRGTPLSIVTAHSAAAIEEHQVEPGAIPKARLLKIDLVSNSGSCGSLNSRKRCSIHDLAHLDDC